MIKLYNSLTKQKEDFKPITDGKVGMYSCGPTVYDYAHIGNFRSYIFADLLRRTLEYSGLEVKQVMNITDVGHLVGDDDPSTSSGQGDSEDKMTKGLKREGKPITIEAMRELAEFYTEEFKKDREALNILPPAELPFASDHIEKQIEIIKSLEEKGFAYVLEDGVYFDTAKDSDYGKLGGLSDELTSAEGAPYLENRSQPAGRQGGAPLKRNQRDFALWKIDSDKGWESPWGQGFPGWHIECSAMSTHYLGDSFDIHTGGIDNAPIHHNNEIAQSEKATGRNFVNYWLHGGLMNVEGGKMAKSEGTGVTIRDIVDKGFSPIVFRYFTLSAHYRSQLSFSWDALKASESALFKLVRHLAGIPPGGNVRQEYKEKFDRAIYDDLGLPEALALAWEIIKDDSVADQDAKATILEFDKVYGLNIVKLMDETIWEPKNIPQDVIGLAEDRQKAREAKDFDKADAIRETIQEKGFKVQDVGDDYILAGK